MRFDLLKKAKRLDKHRRDFNKKWSHMAYKHPDHRPTCHTCKLAHCCYQLTVAGLVEGVIIANYLIQTKQNQLLLKITEQGQEQGRLIEEFQGIGVGGAINPLETGAATEEWFTRQIPCAFLSDGRCLVYSMRPTACATYLVITEPPKCGPPAGGRVGVVNPDHAIAHSIMINSAFDQELYGTPDKSAISVPMPLGTAVLYGARLLLEGPEAVMPHIQTLEPER